MIILYIINNYVKIKLEKTPRYANIIKIY